MAYGDDFPSVAQRAWAGVAIVLATLEFIYCWLVALLTASWSNLSMSIISAVLILIMIENLIVLLAKSLPLRHWLRVCSLVSIAFLVGAPASAVLAAMFVKGS